MYKNGNSLEKSLLKLFDVNSVYNNKLNENDIKDSEALQILNEFNEDLN